ncbi:MAG: Carb-bd dom fam9 protein [Candidatus Poribacteria bacterium]|nr:Carb-bd dom fam9 protein [Candidatus Poribacteria bacterium]
MIGIMALSLLIGISMIVVNCGGNVSGKPKFLRYEVHRLAGTISIDGKWDKPQWRNIKSIEIKNHMGEKPKYQPATKVKMVYDDEHIYVIFRVEDQYVRSVAEEYHGPVWRDSCVEFFFTPGQDLTLGYLNLEVNCGGTALLHYQKSPGQDVKEAHVADMDQIKIAHSLPKIVDPEITEPIVWTIEYRLPFAVIQKYCQITMPEPGGVWRANFYKCAESNSHPHWLTWSFVEHRQPNFHLPAFFGTLEFVQ